MLARNRRCAASLGIMGLALALVAGCSGESTGTVSGSVKFKGKEMDGGYVVFQSEKNTAPPVRAKINSDGNYSAPGVLYGVNKVGVEPPPQSLASKMPKGIADKAKVPADKDAAKMQAVYSATEGTYVDIPREFRTPETSKITVTVDSGAKSLNIEIPPK